MRLTTLISAFAVVFAANAETLTLGTNVVWRGQQVDAAFAAPEAARWKKTDWRTIAGDKKKPGGTWKRTDFFAPASWRGAFVRLEALPLEYVDIIAVVNGEKAGEILRPGGDLDVSRFIRAGETNTLALYYTVSGEGTSHGPWTIGTWRTHFIPPVPLEPPRLVVSHGPQITDVFANTSWREKRLRVEVEVQAGEKVKFEGQGQQWTVSVSVADEAGKVVKSVSSPVSRLASLPCDNPLAKRYAVDIPWADPITWELGRPYLYKANVALRSSTSTSTFDFDLRFGFRELWREGRDLMMNGHKVRFRVSYPYGANANGIGFLRDIGYNVFAYCHNADAYPLLPDKSMLDFFDREGVGVLCSCGNLQNIAGSELHKDEKAAEQYRRFQRVFHRQMRNHPSLVTCYVSMLSATSIGFAPNEIAQKVGTRDGDRLLNAACDVNRAWNPNILYFSHGDGPNGDMANGNIYLNWTPLQEREEWFSQWKTNGVMPWHGAEVGQPYMGCWYDRNRIYVANEHLAEYFGDSVYAAEREDDLVRNRDAGATMPNGHGSDLGHAIVQQHPHYRELERLFVWRSNSRWRADGVGGGQIWFNRQGYGSERCGMYGRNDLLVKKPTNGKKPVWASPAYDAYRLGNLDFCGYAGGFPEHTDKTHAYYAGEKIEKQAVFVWDGAAPRTFVCTATFNGEKKVVRVEKLATGETAFRPVVFTAPDVSKKTAYELTMNFADENGKDWFTDKLSVEVYPGKTTNDE